MPTCTDPRVEGDETVPHAVDFFYVLNVENKLQARSFSRALLSTWEVVSSTQTKQKSVFKIFNSSSICFYMLHSSIEIFNMATPLKYTK